MINSLGNHWSDLINAQFRIPNSDPRGRLVSRLLRIFRMGIEH
jgi:hypothetical protein